ncbi:MAG TPA: DUF1588 domain-containing protein, partial [Polyangia bacterium]|nr:DUF1588 domain-containing protein [Polyangia bacterium]
MKLIRPVLLPILLMGAAAFGACASNNPLLGVGAAGTTGTQGTAGAGEPGNAGAHGTAGAQGTAGAAGTAGAHGTAGAQGTAGAGGAAPTPLRISGVDAINRITGVLWRSNPDSDTLARAQAGQLTTVPQLAATVRSMLADPRAASGVGAFYRWWLNLDALLTRDGLSANTQADMANETETFGVNVTLAMNGTYGMLMTAPFSFINADLANIYDVTGVVGDDLRQVTLDPSQRAGLLTQPGLQALGSFLPRNSPSHRGTIILEQILCQSVPAEPPNVPALVAPPGVTLRAALAAEVSSPVCQACHGFVDPPGLAFETFDDIGRFRTNDNGAPVDVSGLAIRLDSSGSPPVNFSGPIELAKIISASVSAQQCMAKQWVAFVLGVPDSSGT